MNLFRICVLVFTQQIVLIQGNNNTTVWFDNGVREFYVSKETLLNRYEANEYCKNNSGVLVRVKSDGKANFLKPFIQPNVGYFMGAKATLEGRWDDGEKIPNLENRLKTAVRGAKLHWGYAERTCILAKWNEVGKMFWVLADCNAKRKFMCQRQSGQSGLDMPKQNIPQTESVKRPVHTIEALTTAKLIEPHTSATSIGFSFDLASFLIGIVIPMPFLVFAVFMACRISRKKMKFSREDSTNKYAEIVISGTSYENSGHEDSETARLENKEIKRPVNSNGECFHQPLTSESPYVNIGGRSQLYETADTGYERPISSTPQVEIPEVEAYEEMQFNENLSY